MGIKLQVITIQDVAESQLCCGCGACAYMDPTRIQMVDVVEFGRRPKVAPGSAGPALGAEAEAVAICPGLGLEHTFDEDAKDVIKELVPAWGPVLAVYEGYSGNSGIRLAGSSGGAATAIALYCMEQAGMHGTLHIAARPDVPYLNHTVLSTTRQAMLAATGSRYAPASPCDSLQMIADAPSACVFIGKPCDSAATERAAALRPTLREKLGLNIAVFCAGTPSTRGTLEMIRQMGMLPSEVTNVRYRGNGWPGNAVVTAEPRDPEAVRRAELSYADSWGKILQKHRQWRCHVCADHTGEFADIAVGDPWYRPIPEGEPGRSLILVRTERGRRLLEGAIKAGYITAEVAEASVLPASQPNLLRTRGSIWARIWVLRLMGAAAPRFRRMPLFRFWLALSLKEKIQSVTGTARRVFTKGLRTRVHINPFEPPACDRQTRVGISQTSAPAKSNTTESSAAGTLCESKAHYE